MNLDIHSHLINPGYLKAIRKPGNIYGERVVVNDRGTEDIVTATGMAYELIPQLYDPQALLSDCVRAGIDCAVISPVPTLFHYNLDPAAAEGHCRSYNDEIAQIARDYPGRLIGMANVPLQHPELAVKELTRVVEELGMRSVEICSNVAGRNLDEPDFFPFFARAAELGVVVLIHPWFVAGADRLRRYHLINSVGNPFDTTIAAGSLIFSGVLELLPDLKVVLSHGGGAAPFTVGRMNRAYSIRPEARKTLPRPPSSYLGQFYFDTIVHFQPALSYLIEAFGADHVVLGSDFPFHVYDMGDPHPVQSVHDMPQLSAEDKAKVLSGNAKRLLGIG